MDSGRKLNVEGGSRGLSYNAYNLSRRWTGAGQRAVIGVGLLTWLERGTVEDDLLQRDLGSPLHHRVFSVLRSGIMSGRYAEGSYLPGEDALTRQFGVSRATIRRAMQSLEGQGMVERRQGRGTRVIWRAPSLAPLARHRHHFGNPEDGTTVDVLEFGLTVPSADAAEALDLAPGEQALRIVRLRKIGDTPLRLLTNYLPPDMAADFTREEFVRLTMLDALLAHGYACYRVEDEFGAVLADHDTAMTLHVQIGAALIDSRRVFFDRSRRPICFQLTLMSPDRGRVRQVISADTDSPLPPGTAHGLLGPNRGG